MQKFSIKQDFQHMFLIMNNRKDQILFIEKMKEHQRSPT
jgi:hypothetical protein